MTVTVSQSNGQPTDDQMTQPEHGSRTESSAARSVLVVVFVLFLLLLLLLLLLLFLLLLFHKWLAESRKIRTVEELETLPVGTEAWKEETLDDLP